MTILYKLLHVELSDLFSILLATGGLLLLTGGYINAGGIVGILIGNRLVALLY